MHKNWTAEQMPDQSGKVALVTGANSGLGYESSLALARKGATVVMACRNQTKGAEARDRILEQVPRANLDLMKLDLGSLEAVREFVEAFKAKYDRLDILINNAGVMAPPRQETVDGFEMQFGVNHLGPFALTGLLLDRIASTPGARVVTVSSNAQYTGRIKFDDLQSEENYSRYMVYGMTKLANVLFAFELQRRFEAAGIDALSVPTHPGISETNLQSTTAAASGSGLERRIYQFVHAVVSHSSEAGARPQLYAATMPDVKPGDHIGVKWFHLRGQPKKVRAARRGYNQDTARRLWEVSEELTAVRYDLGQAAPA